jgi:hypothetical protein
MIATVLPALAAAALTDHAGTDRGLLVAARRGRTLHALLDTGSAFTPSGRVRRTARPLCGRQPRAWRPADVDGRPLCRTCAGAVRALYGPAALATAATWLRPEDIARTLTTAPDLATVSAAVALLLESGHTGKTALVDGQPVRLTALVASTRSRLSKGPHLTERDRAWFSAVKNAPARRYPRRVS